MLAAAGGRWRRQAELAGATLYVRAHGDITPTTACAALEEIIEPILDNAVRHTQSGGTVEINLHIVHIEASSEPMLIVNVSNTGEAIPADLAAHVFDPWVSSRDASVAGGLGLWLARETARDVGGDVTVVPDAPATTFRVRLPRVDRD